MAQGTISFGQPSTPNATGGWRPSAFAIALALHLAAFAMFVYLAKRPPVRITGAAATQVGIGAFVIPGPAGTQGTMAPEPKPAQPAKKRAAPDVARATMAGRDEASGNADTPGPATGAAGGSGDGPVRVGSGDQLALLKKVVPPYPPILQAGRIEGTVVCEALIHRDGTIGEVKVLRSSRPEFARAATDALQQWRYAPLPYEAILTVNFNFNLPR